MHSTFNSYWVAHPSCIRTTACTRPMQYRIARKQEAPNHRLRRPSWHSRNISQCTRAERKTVWPYKVRNVCYSMRVNRGRALLSIFCWMSSRGLSCSPGVQPASSSSHLLSTEPPARNPAAAERVTLTHKDSFHLLWTAQIIGSLCSIRAH